MAISLPDARQLSDEVLQALRLRALRGCELGFSESDVADLLGICRETVSRWWSAYADHGLDGLPRERTGRPVGSGRTLSDEQAARLRAILDRQSPEEAGIASPLWSRRAVADLIHKEYGITMPVRTVGEYLRRWGYTAKRPRRHAKDQDPDEVRAWLEETPESNADEYLNNDLKGTVNAAGLPQSKEDLRSRIEQFMSKLLHLPEHVRHYFRHPCVQYAAGV
jgi:transposase